MHNQMPGKNHRKVLLSIVVCGRNDDYLGDFKYRIQTSINFLARNAEKIGKLSKIEVVIVDWNSDKPLQEDLRLIAEAAKISVFIRVPPDIAVKYNEAGKGFHACCAANVGIRRARGRFVMYIPADILITEAALLNLFFLLEGKYATVFDPGQTMLNISRKLIPWQVVERKPDLAEWDRYLQLHSEHLQYDSSFRGMCGGMGALLLFKPLWDRSQGFIESYPGWGWTDIEFGLRLNQLYPSVNLMGFGIFVYDMGQKRAKERITNCNTEMLVSHRPETGNEDWGLKGYEFSFGTPIDDFPPQISGGNDPLRIVTDGFSIKDVKIAVMKYAIKNFLKISWGIIRRVIYGGEPFFKGLQSLRNCALFNIKSINEWACLYSLVWCTKSFLPRRYLEYGISTSHCAPLMAYLNPSLEIYGIDSWSRKESEGHSLPLGFPSTLLYDFSHQGYVHFVSGEENTAFERLTEASIGPAYFDLVLLRTDILGANARFEIDKVMAFIPENGALIITGRDNHLFEQTWEYAVSKYPTFAHAVCKRFNTGLFLKRISESGNRETVMAKVAGSADLWHQVKRQIYSMHRMTKILGHFLHV